MYFMKRFFLLTCAALICNYLHAQILVQQVATATFNYNSMYQDSDLHFYLYGDGYHSFDADNLHEFGENAVGNTVLAYHSEPYDVDQVDQLVLNTVIDGLTNATIPNYSLPNKVALKRSWDLVNEEDNFFILMFENRESEDPISGCIEFHFNTSDTEIEGSAILDDYNNDWVNPDQVSDNSEYNYSNKFVWTFADLKADEQRFIYIPADCLANSLEIVETMAVMKVDNCDERLKYTEEDDGVSPDNDLSSFYTLRSQVKNFPHDPNAIVTDPNCLTKRDQYFTVRYKIYFQNDGEDPVVDVDLDFSINAPFHSVELVDASDFCKMTWQPEVAPANYSENIRFLFPEIYLPGLADDPAPEYEDTYGWVSFDLCFNMKVFSQLDIDCTESNVDIYFDLLPPISATNTICRNCETIETLASTPLSTYVCPEILPATQTTGPIPEHPIRNASIDRDEKSSIDFDVYPNPITDILFLDTKYLELNDIVKIRNTSGEIIRDITVKEIEQSINLSEIPSGVYYISVQNDVSVKTKAFVKL